VGLSSNETDILIHGSPARCALAPPARGHTTPPNTTRSGEPETESEPEVDHDATLLVAALEVIESRRAAIEWLVEADLLQLCLV
jgi:hypothetical protein